MRTNGETGCNKVKHPKVGSNAIVPILMGARPNKMFSKFKMK
jgi:hypothetical protein